MALRHFVGYALGMEPNALKKVLDEREAANKAKESDRALVVVFVIIPVAVVSITLILRLASVYGVGG